MARNRKYEDDKSKVKKITQLTSKESRPVESPDVLELFEKTHRLKFIVIGALLFGLLNSYHVSSIFENDRHFSHLSNLEREMSFRTEMGFYYYHYKTIVESETFVDGINKLLNANRTEYPDVINSLQRFSLFPEIFLSGTYHAFIKFLNYFDLPLPQVCYKVSRGGSLPPVVSCEGIGNPMYWYLYGVWGCAGLTAGLIFVAGAQLSDSLLGGLLSAVFFFYNHGEATRVQWSPPLRESFAYPFSLLINIMVTRYLRDRNIPWSRPLIFGNVAMIYLICWQFSQYTLVITLAIVYSLYTIGVCPSMPMLSVLLGSSYALTNGIISHFFSPTLIISPLAGIIIGIFILTIFLEPLIQLLPFPLNISVQLAFLFISSVASKIELEQYFEVEDDSHILNLLKAKFTNYSDFHTSLYTCSSEFDFITKDYFIKLVDTLLFPSVCLSIFLFLASTFSILKANLIKRLPENEKKSKPSPPPPSLETDIWEGVDVGLLYNFILLFAYLLMASLIMRLKLFLTPHLCILASLAASKYVRKILHRREIYYGFVLILFVGMSVRGLRNVVEQRSVVGEYNNPNFEELLEWINAEVGSEAAFAGPMPTMANVLLSTKQPIVNHPHYENANLRHRTKQVYSVFSRKTVKEVYEILLGLRVSYVVLHKPWCLHRSKEGCGMVDLWDKEEPQNARRPALCPRLFHQDALLPFRKVFSNDEFVVLQVPSKVVELKAPRTQAA